jgi:hypothetical protein
MLKAGLWEQVSGLLEGVVPVALELVEETAEVSRESSQGFECVGGFGYR